MFMILQKYCKMVCSFLTKVVQYKCIIIYFEKILLNEEDEYAITI